MPIKQNLAGHFGKIWVAGVILLAALLLIWIGPRRDPPAEGPSGSPASEIYPEADGPSSSSPSHQEPIGASQGAPGGSKNLTASLSPVIRAEYLPPEQLNQTLGWLKTLQPQSELDKNIIAGAEAFLLEDYPAAEIFFEAARLVSGDDIYLPSFLAATALGADEAAGAETRYLKALVAKSRGGLDSVDLSDDQIGLALSLLWLGRPEEARPLAEHAWRSRLRHLGATHPDTLSAANRLAAIQVALGNLAQAEDLLEEAYQGALPNSELTASGLEETRHLLSVIQDQTSRLAEAGSPSVPEVPEPQPLPPPDTIVAENYSSERLAEWRSIATALAGYDDALAADMRRHILRSRMKNEKLPPSHPDLRNDLLTLIEAYQAAGQYEQAEGEAMILLMLTEDKSSKDFTDLADLQAQNFAGQGKYAEAESWWHQAVQGIDDRLIAAKKTGDDPSPADAARSLDLHLKLAEMYIREGRVLQEAEIELRSALARLGQQHRRLGIAAEAHLRLGRILWLAGHERSSRENYLEAQKLASALAGQSGSASEKNELLQISAQAEESLIAIAEKKTPPPYFEPPPQPAANRALPSIELLAQQLNALKILDRASEFGPRLDSILAESQKLYGRGDVRHRPYFNLKLKWLEESGQVDELTAVLKAQADNPPGRSEPERLLNRCSALIYAAGINERSGRTNEAIDLYNQALAAAEGRREKAILARRATAEAALKRLTRQSPN